MTVEFALEYIPRRMCELGYGDNYLLRWRYFNLEEELVIEANNEFYLLIQPESKIIVRSKYGLYDPDNESLNENQYEHKGKIHITNRMDVLAQVIFIQIIPTHKK